MRIMGKLLICLIVATVTAVPSVAVAAIDIGIDLQPTVDTSRGDLNCDQLRGVVKASLIGWDNSTMDCVDGTLVISKKPMTEEEIAEKIAALNLPW